MRPGLFVVFVWLLLSAFSFAALAKDTVVGDLVIGAPWSRATPGGAKVGVGYFSIINTGDQPDRLLAATSPISGKVELHSTRMDDGVMRMRQLENGIELTPNIVVEFKPGGLHLMFINLKKPIVAGDKLPVSLMFETAGKVEIILTAAGVGAQQAPGQEDVDRAIRGSSSGVGHDDLKASTSGR